MNLSTSLGLYAAVTKELGEDRVEIPGSSAFYTGFDSLTYFKMSMSPKALEQRIDLMKWSQRKVVPMRGTDSQSGGLRGGCFWGNQSGLS